MITQATTPSEPPDRSGITEEIRCPLCDYNLHGLAAPRCPECGYAFEWPNMLDPTRRLHPYLFEHHPERNLWSFWRTAIGGLRPRRFWTRLHPAQPSRPRRLLLYFTWISLIYFVSLQLLLAAYVQAMMSWRHVEVTRFRADVLSGRRAVTLQDYAAYGFLRAWLDAEFPAELTVASIWRDVKWFVRRWCPRQQGPLLLLVWPWATFACLLIFQQSMRKVRLRAIHILRCVIYSSDTFLWVWLIAAITAASALYGFEVDLLRSDPLEHLLHDLFRLDLPWWFGFPQYVPGAIGLAATIAFSYRLAVAYRRYLKYDRPIATVLCSQLILWLALFTGRVAVYAILDG